MPWMSYYNGRTIRPQDARARVGREPADLQRREVRLAKRRARGEIVDEVEEEKPDRGQEGGGLSSESEEAGRAQAQREMEELMRQRETSLTRRAKH